ncbi:MAG: 50S ribosomal protein L24 [Desulfosudaceae bacterium]
MQGNSLNIRKNDKVKIIAGKDKGKIGKVLSVSSKKNRVVVEHVNLVKHHKRPDVKFREGGIIEKEAPLHRSNVMLMCSKCVKPVRVRMKQLEDGGRARMCANCKELIDT